MRPEKITIAAFALSSLLGLPSAAAASRVDVCLRVDEIQIPGSPTTPGPFGNQAPIKLWSYIRTPWMGTACDFTAPAPAPTALPFPRVTASVGDTLVIHLKNNLRIPRPAAYVAPPAVVTPGIYTEPVSVVIPGQTGDLTPTWSDGQTGPRTTPLQRPGLQRVRSFTHETPQQNAAAVDYTFGPLKAGTYLLQSGTHPALQVQMGLYGVLTVLPGGGRAYSDASSAFDSEFTLLFSEIDPVLHDAVTAGTYGPAPAPPNPSTDPPANLPAGWLSSTIGYHPKYFLVNGRPFTSGAQSTVIGATNTKVLFRLLNAGLETKVPTLQGQYMSIIAEDGNFLTASGPVVTPNVPPPTCPAPRPQYGALLPAGKTLDAILMAPPAPASIPLYDRRLNLTNSGASPGGMLALLATTSVGGAALPPSPPPPCTLVGAGP
jgi:FtsP/CotA-like multicopper oxidase with cupredoxin domain